MSFLRKIGNAFVSGLAGIITLPFAVTYHAISPICKYIYNSKRSVPEKIIAGIFTIALTSLVLTFAGLATAYGAGLVSGLHAAQQGYAHGLKVGCTSLFSKNFRNELVQFIAGQPHLREDNITHPPLPSKTSGVSKGTYSRSRSTSYTGHDKPQSQKSFNTQRVSQSPHSFHAHAADSRQNRRQHQNVDATPPELEIQQHRHKRTQSF